ncbi:hypothetical protein GGTG_06665 [Gaeumannomyces tritici R3-111a-1]|uniref:Uncharacterized protein n=1 Tax=Gaeumannomyces tritici (strain R3-111a-1) TaxID=644352 RepID=J3NZG6_GAET3|nr:hypothetical protein GGTG_06665 [Gaeumannomyces tritici R3-111a-1]EJT76749.1 hypothetical protein GGTG_06665 [Gaeumannomyces tritici R3-111a-1]
MATGPAHPDKTDTAAEAGPGEGSATYSVFQTSIAKLRMARWRVTPDWKPKSRDEAKDFLRAAPVRDKRTLSEKGLFRMLFVHLPDANQLTLHEDLIEVARNHAWIDSQFASRLRSPSGGMVWLDSRESANMGLAVQAPATAGDGLAYCFSLTNIRGFESDWVCLFVGARDVCPQRVASLMSQDPFPSDFVPPLPPDFMFLPICVLSYDISELARGVDEVNSGVLHIVGQLTEAGIPEAGVPTEIGGSDAAVSLLSEHIGNLHEPTDMYRIRAGRAGLLKIQQKHLALKRRWSFLREFAHKLGSYFELRVASWSKEGDPATYSAALRGRVDRELANLDSLFHELDVIPLRIEAQQASVDSYMSLIVSNFTVDAPRIRKNRLLT